MKAYIVVSVNVESQDYEVEPDIVGIYKTREEAENKIVEIYENTAFIHCKIFERNIDLTDISKIVEVS